MGVSNSLKHERIMYKFPLNPVLGQEHTEGQKSWEWNGIGWEIIAVPNEQVDAAKLAATQARAAVALAEASMNNASASKDAAKVSELASANAKALAEAAANAARLSEVDAESAQTVAESAATSANSSKNVATTKASEASTSATTAETHKNAAAQSATNAATSATAAAGSATTASTKAADATTQAAASLSSANTAKSHADRADAAANVAVGGQIQADFSVTDTASKAFIKNKPSIPTDNNQLANGAGYAVQSTVTAALNTKEPTITASAPTNYWTGAKTFAPLGAAVLNTTLTGLTVVDAAVTDTDTVVGSVGKLLGQMNARELVWKKNASNGYAGLTGTRQVQLPNPTGNIISVLTNTNTAYRAYVMPDKTGTVALMDDVANPVVNSLNGGQLAGFRNYIINGSMDVHQRSGSINVPPGGSLYTLDRFIVANGTDATITVSQATLADYNGSDLTARMRIAPVTAPTTGEIFVLQRIEGVRTLAGQAATMQALVIMGETNAPVRLTFTQNFGAGGAASVGMSSVSGVASFSTGTWTPNIGTISIPSVTGKTVGTGSYLEAVLAITARTTQVISVTGIQVEPGSKATPFERRPYSIELMMCQRYYKKIETTFQSAVHAASVSTSMTVLFNPPMRGTPTITQSATQYTNCTQSPPEYAHADSYRYTVSGTSPGTVTVNGLTIIANAEL